MVSRVLRGLTFSPALWTLVAPRLHLAEFSNTAEGFLLLHESASPLRKIGIGQGQQVNDCNTDVFVGHRAKAISSFAIEKRRGYAPRLERALDSVSFALIHD